MIMDLLNANNILGCILFFHLHLYENILLFNVKKYLIFKNTPPKQADSCGLILNLLDIQKIPFRFIWIFLKRIGGQDWLSNHT